MIHLPFEDRLEAGRALATELRSRGMSPDSVVLAIARGGVPVGFEVADRLCLPLDVVAARKIGVPWQPEQTLGLTLGSVAGQSSVLDERLIAELNVSADDLQEAISREEQESSRREKFYRSGVALLDLRGKAAIIVDDGLASGITALAAIRHVRSLKPFRTILAIPVASRDGYDRVCREVDDAISLTVPEHFYAIGESYHEFPQVSDLAVKTMLSQARKNFLHKCAAPIVR